MKKLDYSIIYNNETAHFQFNIVFLTGPVIRQQLPMYMQHNPTHSVPQRMSTPFGPGMAQRPPNVQVGPEGMPMGSQEWRHMVMSQQQNLNYNNNSGMRPGFNHQGKGFIQLFTSTSWMYFATFLL